MIISFHCLYVSVFSYVVCSVCCWTLSQSALVENGLQIMMADV